MVDDANQNKQDVKENESYKKGGSTFVESLIVIAVLLTFLWNWDGFWQTDIQFIEKLQQEYFSSKYNNEQLKLSRIADNNKVIERIKERLDRAENRAEKRIQEANHDRDVALVQRNDAQAKLQSYLDKENRKCRYYDTSLRMIDRLRDAIPGDELKRKLSCTNSECEQILNYRSEATAICN